MEARVWPLTVATAFVTPTAPPKPIRIATVSVSAVTVASDSARTSMSPLIDLTVAS